MACLPFKSAVRSAPKNSRRQPVCNGLGELHIKVPEPKNTCFLKRRLLLLCSSDVGDCMSANQKEAKAQFSGHDIKSSKIYRESRPYARIIMAPLKPLKKKESEV